MSTITAVTTPFPPEPGTWIPRTRASSSRSSTSGIATVRGHFAEFEGTLEVGEDLERATASGVVKVDSVNTNDAKRDDHLRSADFFDVEQYEHITFESKASSRRTRTRSRSRATSRSTASPARSR